MKKKESYYIIDARDVIRSWGKQGSDQYSWNQADASCLVPGQSVWGFLDGEEAKMLYKALFEKVRTGCSIGPVSFRCDSDQERVFMELFLEPLEEGSIGVSSYFIKSEPRRLLVRLFDSLAPRSDEIVTICSMCKKIKELDGRWVVVEEGIETLKLFEMKRLPRLSHGLCPNCYESIMREAGLPLTPAFV